MKRWLIILGVVSIIVLSGCAKEVGIVRKADQYIEEFNKVTTGEQVHGHVFVAKAGEVLINKGYGKADYERNTDITEDTVFLIGSVTKPITALAIMKLHEEGLLNVNDPVSKYIPQQTRGDEMTIGQLLNHTSGLKRDSQVSWYRYIDLETLVSTIAAEPLQYDPGTTYHYSNAAYSLLARIIEVVSGQTYQEYLNEYIFDPLGMDSTGAAASNEELPEMAVGYYVADSKVHKVMTYIYDVSVFSGAGNIYSTAADLYLLDRALYTEELLARETVDTMVENGWGWGIFDYNGHKGFGHNGLLSNGYSASYQRFPDEDLVVIVLMNVRNEGNLGFNIGQVLTTIVLGEEYSLPHAVKKVQLAETELNQYTGEYDLEGNPVAIRRDAGHLVLEPLGERYVPASNNEFYREGSEYKRLEFAFDAAGNVTGFTWKECVVGFWAKKR